MKIAFIPIDNRPVCYSLPKMIAKIDENIDFSIPPRSFLGSLKENANIDELFNWLMQLPKQDAIIISLDTLAYGGLIPSRRTNETFEEIKSRLEILKEILKEKNAKIYAFSSIMRISNNNYNEEEKEYWSNWGEKIFKYSYDTCKNKSKTQIKTDVPSEIIDDYMQTRKRNFEINKLYLSWQNEGIFDTLIFSKDDCAEFGFNVEEAKELKALGGYTKTGADEIPLSLLARAYGESLNICPIFTEPNSKNLISNYEDLSLEKSVLGQIELCGCNVSDVENADIILYINNFLDSQGEIVMKKSTKAFEGSFVPLDKPYMIADVRFANGADNSFVDSLFNNKFNKNFFGYSAWNTTANTLGSLLCVAKFKYFSKKYNDNEFKKLQIVRFLDDWAYQANVRQELKSIDIEQLQSKMEKYQKILEKKFETNINAHYTFPWDRLFEVEVWI